MSSVKLTQLHPTLYLPVMKFPILYLPAWLNFACVCLTDLARSSGEPPHHLCSKWPCPIALPWLPEIWQSHVPHLELKLYLLTPCLPGQRPLPPPCYMSHVYSPRSRNRCAPLVTELPTLAPRPSRPCSHTQNPVPSLQGYTHPREYIVTEWPTSQTLGDLWSLVFDHDCAAVVVLCYPTNPVVGSLAPLRSPQSLEDTNPLTCSPEKWALPFPSKILRLMTWLVLINTHDN